MQTLLKLSFNSGKLFQSESQFITSPKRGIQIGQRPNWRFLSIHFSFQIFNYDGNYMELNSAVVNSSGRNIVLKQWICTPFASFWVKSSFSLFEFPTDNWVFLGFQFETSFSYPDDPPRPDTKLQAICITISM